MPTSPPDGSAATGPVKSSLHIKSQKVTCEGDKMTWPLTTRSCESMGVYGMIWGMSEVSIAMVSKRVGVGSGWYLGGVGIGGVLSRLGGWVVLVCLVVM